LSARETGQAQGPAEIPHCRRTASRSAVRIFPGHDARVEKAMPWRSFEGVHHGGSGYFARISKLSVKEVLLKLKEAGVDSLPGGGAEIFHPRVRKIICDHKVSGQMWLNVARQAHEIGLRSNATMLYGHVETEVERVDHLV